MQIEIRTLKGLTTFHEGNTPIDTFCKSLAEQGLGDVAFRVEDGTNKVRVVDRF